MEFSYHFLVIENDWPKPPCFQIGWFFGGNFVIIALRRGGEEVTQLFAEQIYRGSIPLRASKRAFSSAVERFSDKEEVDGPTPSSPTLIFFEVL